MRVTKLMLSLLVISQTAFADCDMRMASANQNQYQTGPILNLTKTISTSKCTVVFDMEVNGEMQHLTQSITGIEYEERLCIKAIELARKEHLASLGGNFKTDAVTVCQENGRVVSSKIKVGDTILESEVGTSKMKDYFTYKGARCRMFKTVSELNGQLKTYNGVICQIDNSDTNWLIVDKW